MPEISAFALSAIFAGYITALTLIMAIGAQNAFVLRQGLRRANVLAVVLVCACSDAILVTVGVFGFEWVESVLPGVLPVIKFGGAAFLFVYGAFSFRAAWRGGESLNAANGAEQSTLRAVLTCLALTWTNPHVYLDTVVLLGSLSAPYGDARFGFGLGAALASFSFFFALGYGARFLAPVFAKPAAWRVLEVIIGVTMWTIALNLLLFSA